VRPGFMEFSVAQKWVIYLQTILAIYDNRYRKTGEKVRKLRKTRFIPKRQELFSLQ